MLHLFFNHFLLLKVLSYNRYNSKMTKRMILKFDIVFLLKNSPGLDNVVILTY